MIDPQHKQSMADQDLLRAENVALLERIRELELQLAKLSPAADQSSAGASDVPGVLQPEQIEATVAHHTDHVGTEGGSAQTAALAGADNASGPALGGPSPTAGQSASAERQGSDASAANGSQQGPAPPASDPLQWSSAPHGLTQEQVGRYSRQLMLPSFGVEGAACLPAQAETLCTN